MRLYSGRVVTTRAHGHVFPSQTVIAMLFPGHTPDEDTRMRSAWHCRSPLGDCGQLQRLLRCAGLVSSHRCGRLRLHGAEALGRIGRGENG